MKTLTEKEFKVLAYFVGGGYDHNHPIHGILCKRIIFDKETVDKYSFARKNKTVIDTMTLSYLGKMTKKGYLDSSYNTINDYAYYEGHCVTTKGKEAFKNHSNSADKK